MADILLRRHKFFDPGTITLISTGLAVVQGVGSIVEGVGANAQGAQIEAEQQRLRKSTEQQLMSLVNQTRLSEYDRMASRDVSSAINAISQAMSERGLGSNNTAALAGMGNTIAGIRSEYSRAGMEAQNQATSTAAQGLANLANSEPLGYNPTPFGGVGNGVQAAFQNLFQLASMNKAQGGVSQQSLAQGINKPAALTGIGRLP